MLGGEDEEGGAEQRVGAGREDGEVEPELLAAEDDLGALGAPDPVALHRDDVLGPRLEQLEVVEQPLGVVGDAEEPLLERRDSTGVPQRSQRPSITCSLASTVCVLRAPLHRRLGAVGEPALEQLQEDPLRPAVVVGLVGGELARPVDRDAPGAGTGRGTCSIDVLGRDARVLAGLDRVVLGRQPEGVVAHRVDHPEAVAAAEVGDRVADRRRS